MRGADAPGVNGNQRFPPYFTIWESRQKHFGFSAGFTGKEIERRMAEIGFAHDFISYRTAVPESMSN